MSGAPLGPGSAHGLPIYKQRAFGQRTPGDPHWGLAVPMVGRRPYSVQLVNGTLDFGTAGDLHCALDVHWGLVEPTALQHPLADALLGPGEVCWVWGFHPAPVPEQLLEQRALL